MKFLFLLVLAAFSSVCGFSQKESFGLLKFNIPTTWQQQTRMEFTTFLNPNPEATLHEIMCFSPEASAPKIDSSFKSEWSRLLPNAGTPLTPKPKKRASFSGLNYAENGAEADIEGKKQFVQLYVFAVDNRVQSFILVAESLEAFKKLREEIAAFLDSVDTIKKRKD
jgi:hypothetical protein